jgi:quercetin dioxygenase-like cupin family protein
MRDGRRVLMDRRRIATVVAVFAAGALVGAAMPVPTQSAGSKVTNLLTVALSTEFTPDREVRIDLVEIPPNQTLDSHRHPGEEFHYYLEGDPVIELRGASPIIGNPGTVGHVAFKQPHRATAGDRGAKIIVFRVHTKGAPWRDLDETDDRRRQR